MDLKEQARTLTEALDAKNKEASTAWAEFDKLRKSAVDEGVDFSQNADAFKKLDEAGKAYDGARQEAEELKVRQARLLEMLGQDAPKQSNPFNGNGAPAPTTGTTAAKSWGQRYTESDVFQNLIKSGVLETGANIGTLRPFKVAGRDELRATLESKATLTTLTDTGVAGSAGAGLFEQRLPGIIGIGQPPLNVLDVITMGTTDERTVSWVIESLFTNAAAETAENAPKPETSFGFEEAEAVVRDIAHWTKVTRQTVRDVAGIQTWLNNRMVYGVRNRLQRQVINGDGTGVNLLGMYNQPGILDYETVDPEPMVEAIHKAMTLLRTTQFQEPNGVLLHPTDWETIRLSKDGNGQYFYGGPAQQGVVTLWGLPAVVSVHAVEGTPLVADFAEASFWLREGLNVAMTDSDGDDFRHNRITIRAEMAGAFGLLQPAAFATVSPDTTA